MKKAAKGFSLLWLKRKEKGLVCDMLVENKTVPNSWLVMYPGSPVNTRWHCLEQARGFVLSCSIDCGSHQALPRLALARLGCALFVCFAYNSTSQRCNSFCASGIGK